MGTGELIDQLRIIVGPDHVVTEAGILKAYSHDETEEVSYLPEVVVKPRTALEISHMLRLCNEFRIPVTPRGGGTGLSGSALPQVGGGVVSTERMHNRLESD